MQISKNYDRATNFEFQVSERETGRVRAVEYLRCIRGLGLHSCIQIMSLVDGPQVVHFTGKSVKEEFVNLICLLVSWMRRFSHFYLILSKDT